MTRKRISQISLLVLVIAASIFALTSKNKTTIKQELRNFAVEDTAAIDKVFLVDKAGNSVLLEKKAEHWTVEQSYEARADLVNLLLKTLHLMRIKEPVSHASREVVLTNLAVKSIKVELYKKNKLDKTFYVGGPTQDSYGTYMIMENSTTPFVLEIPGFRGYLSTRFSTVLSEWKTQNVFNYTYNEVHEVIFEDHKDKSESFLLKKEGGDFTLFSYPEMDQKKIQNYVKAKEYIAHLKNKNFSKYVDDVPQAWQDSIKTSSPLYSITIIDIHNNEKYVQCYNKPAWGRIDAFGEKLEKDPDHFFMLINYADFVYAQYFVFDPLLRGLSNFTSTQ